MRSVRRFACISCALLGIGCHAVSGLNDFEIGIGGSMGGASAGGEGGEGGAGGKGSPGPTLVGDGLLGRYFIDEEFEGEPDTLLDSAGDRDLNVIAAGNLQYTRQDGHRGVQWAMEATGGRAEDIGLADALHQTTTATVEVVMAIPGGSSGPPRIVHIGGGLAPGRFTVAREESGITLRINDIGERRCETVGVPSRGHAAPELSAFSGQLVYARAMKDFRDLKVWHKAHELALHLYRATRAFPREELYGLTTQLRRGGVSVASNIAEGCGRGSDADFARCLQIAAGAASEVAYQLLLARDLELLRHDEHSPLDNRTTEVKRMLTSLIQRLKAES